MDIFVEWIPQSWDFSYQVSAAVAFDELFRQSFENSLKYAPAMSRTVFLNGDHFSTFFTFKQFSRSFVGGTKLALVWVDAHVDLNLPYESPSGNLHGMIVRHLLGEGYDQLVSSPLIDLKNLYLVGGFERDPGEDKFLAEFNIKVLSSDELGKLRLDSPVFISFDFDILKRFYAVNTETDYGFSVEDITKKLKLFVSNNNVVALDFNEYNAYKDTNMECFHVAERVVSEMLEAL